MAEKEKPKKEEKKRVSPLKFIPDGMPRRLAEALLSSIPGMVILCVAIFLVGILNAYQNLGDAKNDSFVLVYIPIICLLPVVVGVIGPLILERIRNIQRLSLKQGVLSSFLSGFVGSTIGAIILLTSGVVSGTIKPFGVAISSSIPAQLLFVGVLILLSTFLSVIGAALITVVLNKAEE
jgi:hypothetical protein